MENHEAIYYTVQQAAGRYGVSVRIIYAALNSGALKGIRIGGWRISEDALREFEAAGGIRPRHSEPENRPMPVQVRQTCTRPRRSGAGAVVKKITI